MGLSGVDDGTGVRFKKRNNKHTTIKNKDLDIDVPGLVIEKVKKESKPKSVSLLDDLKAMSIEENRIMYKALIDGAVLDYSFATDTDVNDTKLKAFCLGRGILVNSNFNPDIISGNMIDAVNTKLLYFWLKVPDIDSNVVSIPTDIISVTNHTDDSKHNCDDTVVDQDDLINKVNHNKKDLTMTTNKKYTKANELLVTIKESGDAGVEVLIDYCRMSFAEVFTKTNNGEDVTAVASDLQNQLVYIITEINKNDLLTPESKDKLTEAIENESIEYQKLLESLTDVATETKELLEKKESDDMSWGTVTLIAIGAVLAIGAAYSLYRYFEPEDVVIDMSTMSIMDR